MTSKSITSGTPCARPRGLPPPRPLQWTLVRSALAGSGRLSYATCPSGSGTSRTLRAAGERARMSGTAARARCPFALRQEPHASAPLALLALPLALVSLAPPAVAQRRGAAPVLHEPIPPDAREDVALAVSLDGDIPGGDQHAARARPGARPGASRSAPARARTTIRPATRATRRSIPIATRAARTSCRTTIRSRLRPRRSSA